MSVKDGRDHDGVGTHAVEDGVRGEGEHATSSDVTVDLREAERGLGDVSKTLRTSSRKRTATRGSAECSRYQSAAPSMSRAAAARTLYFTRIGGVGCALQEDEP